MATYPSLSKIESTDAQDLGLQIDFKEAVNAKHTTAQSPEEYLAEFVIAKLEDFEVAHIKVVTSPELKAKADEAIKNGTPQQDAAYRAFMMQNYGVDLIPTIPADKP